jgi:Domain of unknown function (DUF4351)
MQLSSLYIERIAAAEQVGRTQGCREMVLLLLNQKFGSLPVDVLAQIESLDLEQLQALTGSILSLSSISELSTWLNTSEISDS